MMQLSEKVKKSLKNKLYIAVYPYEFLTRPNPSGTIEAYE